MHSNPSLSSATPHRSLWSCNNASWLSKITLINEMDGPICGARAWKRVSNMYLQQLIGRSHYPSQDLAPRLDRSFTHGCVINLRSQSR
eukprot:scaffold432906_cov53-Prasinocladus_malaysianus.AAC.2